MHQQKNKTQKTRWSTCTRSHVLLLSWGSAAGRGEPAGSAPAGGCRPGLSAGAQTTARHLFNQTAQEKKTVRYVDKPVKEIRNVHTGMRLCRREKTAAQNIWLSSVYNKQVFPIICCVNPLMNNIQEKQRLCLSWKLGVVVSALSLHVRPLRCFLFFPIGVVFVGLLLSVKGLSTTWPLADGLCVFRSQIFKKIK